jgi:predicted transcriptional regulator
MTKYITFLSLFIFLIFSTTALSDDGGYVVRPHADDGMGVDSTGADATITFWDLPLWIQVYYVSGLLIALLVSLKIFPAVISCIKRFVKNQNRQNISKYIVDNPGTTKAEISSNLGINRGTVKYHVHKLESDSKIASMKVSKFTKLFKNSSELKNDKKISTVHWHANKFLADDMIRFEKEGRYLKYYVKDDVAVVMPVLYPPIGGTA